MSVPADAPAETVFCGDLRREPDGRWFFGSTYLGKDGETRTIAVSALGNRLGVVAARLAQALGETCDAVAMKAVWRLGAERWGGPNNGPERPLRDGEPAVRSASRPGCRSSFEANGHRRRRMLHVGSSTGVVLLVDPLAMNATDSGGGRAWRRPRKLCDGAQARCLGALGLPHELEPRGESGAGHPSSTPDGEASATHAVDLAATVVRR